MTNNDDTLQHIKEVELLILRDFIDICDENDLDYYLWFGTEIGAVRHQGFIPWDDDIDIVIFREEYEKFLKIMEEKDCDKYTILDSRYDEQYFFQFGRFSLNGTYWAEFWDKYVDFKLGMHVDLFILDKVPKNRIRRFLFMRTCLILCKFYAISTIKFEEGNKLFVAALNISHSIFNSIGLTPKFFQKRLTKFLRKHENDNSTYFADLTMNEQPFFDVTDFKPPKIVKFEDVCAKVANNQEATLGQIFGDYMQLPPEEERVCHVLNEIDFGKY